MDILSLLKPSQGVTSDSRSFRPGMIYVAVRGGSYDGHQFLDKAASGGAAALVGEEDRGDQIQGVPYFRVTDTRLELSRLASAWHGHPSRDLLVVGITGTSGKTTTSYLIESILKAGGYRVGVIGTVGIRFENQEIPATHTTPDSLRLQELLAEFKKRGATAVVMEVSSHALEQRRPAFVAFDVAVWTNLSPEHLDYHGDMERYFAAKKLLFTDYSRWSEACGKTFKAVVNANDPFGQRLISSIQTPVIPFGLEKLTFSTSGIEGRAGEVKIQSSLVGSFNGENILAAVAVGKALGLDAQAISRGVAAMTSVPGRLERVGSPQDRIAVWVDYAHKPEALRQVLQTLRALTSRRLITVFGCGGDRDRQKRPVMGRLAAELSDKVWVTSDNPRSEDPQAIIANILAGVPDSLKSKVCFEVDRARAIQFAMEEAQSGDALLIAGKGHETYQIIGDQTRPFDDREIAAAALLAKSSKGLA